VSFFCFVLVISAGFLIFAVIFKLGETVDCALTRLVELPLVLLRFGPDRGDDERVVNLPIERPPRTLAGLGAQLPQVIVPSTLLECG
jgi:hypothetical protein